METFVSLPDVCCSQPQYRFAVLIISSCSSAFLYVAQWFQWSSQIWCYSKCDNFGLTVVKGAHLKGHLETYVPLLSCKNDENCKKVLVCRTTAHETMIFGTLWLFSSVVHIQTKRCELLSHHAAGCVWKLFLFTNKVRRKAWKMVFFCNDILSMIYIYKYKRLIKLKMNKMEGQKPTNPTKREHT